MDDQVIWGVLLILYVVPWAAWTFNRQQTIDVRRKLYPGRTDEERMDASMTRTGLMLAAGLAFLLVAWLLGWHPIPSAILLALAALVLWLAKRLLPRVAALQSRNARLWIAGSAFWLLCVAAWYAVFRHDSALDDWQFFLVAVLPPALSGVGLTLYRWATSDSKSGR